MDTPKRDKEKGLTIGLVAIIIVIVILALIGFFLLEPRTETIQGQAEATQIRISGKLPGRIAEYWVEEGQHVHKAIHWYASHHPTPKPNSCKPRQWKVYTKPQTRKSIKVHAVKSFKRPTTCGNKQ